MPDSYDATFFERGRSLVELTRLGLIDEYQLCLHPVIAGGGLPLFGDITGRVELKLIRTQTLKSGAINLYYERAEK